ncbi:MAG TPA: aminotransferase class I/II-fold pyridoxal phosphate-dependent enzyme [Candidatus Aminicenantes bacterium]|nr:aminotransferase class I/II-fold pyridoxal phosphate-dependent enzyme [Candidatus Aminicenantes bacterium]
METKVIHSGQEPDPVYGGVSVPIYQSSTFAFQSVEQGAARFAGLEKGYIYTRIANPTIKALEDRVASLENGYGGIATSSGMAAISTIIFGLLEKGSHLISTASVYGSTRVMIENLLPRFGISADFTDTSNLDNIRKLIRPTTKILFIETPANPTLVLTDIAACATLAQEENLTLVVDNTFASPILQNPLDLGADIVVHSVTKFLNGHSDVVGGIIIPRDEETYQKMHKTMTLLGGNMDPHQAWLVLRGIQTLAIRVQKSQENALKLAQFLSSHPKVAWVNYPGLPSHPQHELAQRQMRGFGAMICFGLKGGYEAGKKMINSVRVATLAVSLGGVESLIQHPASMTHAGVSQEEKEQAGITEDLIRLSVGCEGYEDLRSDLEQALEKD